MTKIQIFKDFKRFKVNKNEANHMAVARCLKATCGLQVAVSLMSQPWHGCPNPPHLGVNQALRPGQGHFLLAR